MVAAAILAGGMGRRLGGVSKPFLMVQGQTIVHRQLSVLRPLFSRLVIVAPDPAPFARAGIDVPVIADRQGPLLGPLAGLDAALAWLPANCHAVVCVAADMPFLSSSVLCRLRDVPPPGAPAVVPRLGPPAALRPQPLCARYHRAIGAHTAAELAAGTRTMRVFLDTIPTGPGGAVLWLDEEDLRPLDPTLATFRNLNTPADLDQA